MPFDSSFLDTVQQGMYPAPAAPAPAAPAPPAPAQTHYTGLGGVFAGNSTPSLNPPAGQPDIWQTIGSEAKRIGLDASDFVGALVDNSLQMQAIQSGRTPPPLTERQKAVTGIAQKLSYGAAQGSHLSAWQPQDVAKMQADPYANTPAANIAGEIGSTVGTVAPWMVASAATGGVADVAGLGAGALETAPLWEQILAAAGRGELTSQLVNAITRTNPISQQGAQNAILGPVMETTGGLVGKAVKGLPAVLSRPITGGVSMATGTAASAAAMTPEERKGILPAALKTGAAVGALDLFMAMLGGSSVFAIPGGAAAETGIAPETAGAAPTETTPAPESQETPQIAPGQEQPPGQVGTTPQGTIPYLKGDDLAKAQTMADQMMDTYKKMSPEDQTAIQAASKAGDKQEMLKILQKDPATKQMIGGVGAANPRDIAGKIKDMSELQPPQKGTPEEAAQAQKLALAQKAKLDAQAEDQKNQDALKKNPTTDNDIERAQKQGRQKTQSRNMPLDERIRRIYAATVDNQYRIKNFTDFLAKRTAASNIDLPLKDKLDLAASLMVGADTTAHDILYKNMVDPDGNIIEGSESVKAMLSRIPKEYLKYDGNNGSILDTYMTMKRAVDVLARGKKVFPDSMGYTPDEAGSEKARARVAYMESKYPELKQIGEDFYKNQDTLMQSWLVGSGYWSQAQYDAMKAADPHHIKYQREVLPAERSQYSIGKQMTGSQRAIYSFVDSYIEDVTHIVNKVRANDVNVVLHNDIIQYGDPDNPVPTIPGWGHLDYDDQDGLAKEAQEKMNSHDLADDSLESKAMDELREPVDDPKTIQSHGNGVVARINGKAIRVEIDDPELKDVMQHIKPQAQKIFIISAVNHAFREATVGLNPIFAALRHGFFEYPPDFFASKTINAYNPVDYVKFVTNLTQAMFDEFQGGVLGKTNERFDTYQAMGGGRASPAGDDISGLARTRRDIVPGEWQSNPIKAAMHVWDNTKTFIRNFDAIFQASGKLSEFGRWRKIDDSPEGRKQAFAQSQAVGINYGHIGGAAARQANEIIPFLNVGIQSVDAMGRALTESPSNAAQVLTKVFTTLVVPSVALTLYNLRNPYYNGTTPGITGLSQYNKDHYFCIPDLLSIKNGYATKFIKLPKPKGWGVLFSTLPEHIITAIYQKNPKQMTNWGDDLLQYFTPVDESNIVQPAYGVWANKSYTGSPIVSSKLSQLSPEFQSDQNDTWLAKEVGQKAKLSPKDIDYLMQSYTGVFDQLASPGKTLQSDLIADPSKSNDIETNYYNRKAQLNQAIADFKQKGVKTADYNPALARVFDSTAKGTPGARIEALRTAIQNVQNSKLSDTQKQTQVSALQQIMDALMQQVLAGNYSVSVSTKKATDPFKASSSKGAW
ncbi:MAG: LPD38 domain-containing protein [Thermacetogeniaceae bacterium]|jgi:hypothetical protein